MNKNQKGGGNKYINNKNYNKNEHEAERENRETILKNIKVQLETEQRREWKKKILRYRELQAVEVRFMVGGKDRYVRLLPSLSNFGW